MTNPRNQSVQKPTASSTETVHCPPAQRDTPYQDCLYPNVMLTDSTHLNSVTALLDIVGVWTTGGRRDKEPGLHLVHLLWTVTNQMNHNAPKPTVNTNETESRPPLQRGILYMEHTHLNVTKMDNTHHCSVTAPQVNVGVWTAQDRKDQEPGRQQVNNPKTVTNQMNLNVLKLTASTTETACRPPLQKVTRYTEHMHLNVTKTDNTCRCSVSARPGSAGVWTVTGRREQGQGRQLDNNPQTATNQWPQPSVLRVSASDGGPV